MRRTSRVGYVMLQNLAASAMLGIASLAIGSMISYGLGSSARGILGIAGTVGSLAATLGSLGLAEAIVRWVSSGREARFRNWTRIAAIAVLGSIFMGALAGWFVSHLDGMPSPLACSMLVASIAGGASLWSIPSAILLGRRAFRAWNVFRILGAIAWATAIAIGIGTTGSAESINRTISIIGVTFALMTTIFALPAVLTVIQGTKSITQFYRPDIKGLLKFGIPSATALAMLVASQSAAQIFAASRTSLFEVGQLVAASAYALMVAIALQALASLAYPKIAATSGSAQVQAMTRYTTAGSTLALAVLLPGTLLAPFAVVLLNGREFSTAGKVASLLVAAALMDGLTLVIEQGLKARGRSGIYFWVEGVRLVLLIAVLYMFGHDIWSIALSILSVSAVVLAIAVAVGRVDTDASIRDLVMPMSPRQILRTL